MVCYNTKVEVPDTTPGNDILVDDYAIPRNIELNVAGRRFKTTTDILMSVPDTRLSNIQNLQAHRIGDENLYFFDRDPDMFAYIFDLYQTHELHLPKGLCSEKILTELRYWQISPLHISPCCWPNFCANQEHIEMLRQLNNEDNSQNRLLLHRQSLRTKLHNILEGNSPTLKPKVYGIISLSFTLMALAVFFLSTKDGLKKTNDQVDLHEHIKGTNGIYHSLNMLDKCCFAFFVLELGLRLYAIPERYTFLKNALNVADLFSLVPYIVQYTMDGLVTQSEPYGKISWQHDLNALKVLRVFRLTKVFWSHAEMKVLCYTIMASTYEYSILILFLSLFLFFVSTSIYFAENSKNTNFPSIPSSFLWSIGMVTHIGFGESTPSTVLGKIIGSLCLMAGIVFIAFATAITLNNFTKLHKQVPLYSRLTVRNQREHNQDPKHRKRSKRNF